MTVDHCRLSKSRIKLLMVFSQLNEFKFLVRYAFTIALMLFVTGCGNSSTSNYSPLLEAVVACDAQEGDEASLSCRTMAKENGVLIEKRHSFSQRDEVYLSTTSTEQPLSYLIPDCKLRGHRIDEQGVLVICYLNESNVASGRSLNASETLTGLYFDSALSLVSVIDIPEALGFDRELLRVNNSDVFCTTHSCFSLIQQGDNTDSLTIKTLLSVNDGIIRNARMQGGSLEIIGEIKSGWFYQVNGDIASRKDYSKPIAFGSGEGVIELKSIDEELAQLLRLFSKFDANSGFSYGETNMEGRVAWSHFYYLSALGFMADLIDNKDLLNEVVQRIDRELSATFNEQLNPARWMVSKRYSLNRSELLFQMHTGRALTLLRNVGSLVPKQEGIAKELEALMDYGVFAEQYVYPSSLDDPDYWSIAPSAGWFYLRKGIDFWADGLQVPFNYVSAICTDVPDNHWASNCKNAMSYLEAEILYFAGARWRYWPGEDVNDGYNSSEHRSFNTPEYSGNQDRIAHDSYLAMDAIAVLRFSDSAEIKKIIKGLLASDGFSLEVFPYLDTPEMQELCTNEQFLARLSLPTVNPSGAKFFYVEASRLWARDKCSALLAAQ